MRLKNGKSFPEDYILYEDMGNDAEYKLKKTGEVFKYIKVGGGKNVVLIQHHPITFLIEDLIMYDLTDRKEKAEFLALTSIAMYIDDYNLLMDKQAKVTGIIHELSGVTDFNEFVEDLERAEGAIDRMGDILEISEVREARAEKGRETVVISFEKKKAKPKRKKKTAKTKGKK